MNEAAVNLVHQSEAARKRGDKGVAKKLIQAALAVDDTLPGAWYNLGSDLHNEGNRVAAIAALRRCGELAGEEPYSLTNLGWNLQLEGRFEEARDILLRAINANIDLPLGWSNLSLAYNSLHKPVEAISAAREAVKLAPDDAQHHMALAFALMMAGHWPEGLKEYEWRFQYKMPEFLAYPMPRWDGGYVETLFAPAEQGLGDTLQFGRFVEWAAARVGTLIAPVQEELYDLACGSLALLPNVQVLRMPCAIPPADAFCPLMSLPVAMGFDDDAVADTPHDWLGEGWKTGETFNFPGSRKKIGIIWAGSADQDNDRHRSATVEDFLGLYEAKGVQLYSFQVGDRAKECRKYAPLVIDLAPRIRDFTDTAALMCEMDAIVSVCTSTAHLAGSLGLKTHIVLPRHGQHFVWGHSGSETPWYPTARLHRQERIGDWASVISSVAGEL
jgi:tetratricopeptide (TPR) repeat protein